MTMPLAGIKVLDLSAYIAGPYGCALLADMGAEVIKVEPPGGDNLRHYPSTLKAESRGFLGVNRNKKSILIDIKNEQGYGLLIELVRQADVLVHNFRPAVPRRLKIDFDTLHAVNSRLVYCALTGYGNEGPLADYAGYDQVLQAMTGICASQGPAGGPPEVVYGSVVDYYGASLIANGATAALYQREKTGLGQEVNVSLLGSALAMQSTRLIWADSEPKNVERDMRSGGVTGIYPTKEGYLYLSANTAHFWKALCEHVGLPALAENEAYDTVKKRAHRADEIVPLLRDVLRTQSAEFWVARFKQSVPSSVVHNVEDMFEHPQALAQGYVAQFSNKNVGGYKGVSNLIKFGRDSMPAPQYGAPSLGEHTSEILATLGYSKMQIAGLLDAGAVK